MLQCPPQVAPAAGFYGLAVRGALPVRRRWVRQGPRCLRFAHMYDAFQCDQSEAPVFLAPMAGISDLPFRTVALRHGASLVVSEMVASEEVMRARPVARARAELGLGAARTSVQIAGREARWMAEAARYCAGQGARIIDINLGCPAKKVTNGLSGSALMRDPDHALRLIEAVASAVDVPVTVKMRLGWDATQMNAPEIAARPAGGRGSSARSLRSSRAGARPRHRPGARSRISWRNSTRGCSPSTAATSA